jgi:hypothetical protein
VAAREGVFRGGGTGDAWERDERQFGGVGCGVADEDGPCEGLVDENWDRGGSHCDCEAHVASSGSEGRGRAGRGLLGEREACWSLLPIDG